MRQACAPTAGFDLFKGNMHAALRGYWDYDYQIQDQNSAPGEWRTEAPPVKSLPGIAPTNYSEVVKAADTLEWVTAQEQADAAKPWFAWLAFNLSHATAVQVPSAMAIPNADTLDEASRAEAAACGGEFGTNNTGTCSGETLMRVMTNSMDTIIGKVLDAVDALDPNTYIIYIGDNGTPMYARPNLDHIDNLYITRTGRGKGSGYESGARVPLSIRGPGIAPNSTSSEYVHAVDLFSTSLQLAVLCHWRVVCRERGVALLPADGGGPQRIVSGPDGVSPRVKIGAAAPSPRNAAGRLAARRRRDSR